MKLIAQVLAIVEQGVLLLWNKIFVEASHENISSASLTVNYM